MSSIGEQASSPLTSGSRALGILRKYVLRANAELLTGCLEIVQGELQDIEEGEAKAKVRAAPSKITVD
ncbi:hypothetical protein [Hyalangium versicolor]|uniref:hypothetical protein n=1 Tax=Hyalangium versicolor TaxID=2861190 RepID=UPI001CCC1F3C|nr:hypothetical protein [Hyalangium versicolor]